MLTDAQSAAYINGQAAMLNAEIAGMMAANQCREHQGEAQAYGEEAFQEVIDRYMSDLRSDCSWFLLINGERP